MDIAKVGGLDGIEENIIRIFKEGGFIGFIDLLGF